MLQDVGTVHRVMATLLRYLDQGSKWQQGQLVEVRDAPQACIPK